HLLTADVSLGHGRVRDATGVQLARLLEARLLEAGAIRAPLSRAAKERIAALYYLRPSLSVAHERPDRFFWREVGRVLREVGAEAELHLPAGPRWQIDASGRVVGQNHKFPRTADVYSSAAASYLVADRWAITGSVFQARYIRRAGPFQVYASDGWSVAYSIG